MKKFKDLLLCYMQREGHNDESLSKELGVSKTTIHNWRTGKVKNIQCGKIKKCAEVLKLNPIESREFRVVAGCLPAKNDENVSLIPIVKYPILQPRQFFGRKQELEQIFRKWQYLPINSIAIIGPKRSGKTSLLHYIHSANSLHEGQHQNELPSHYQLVFVDFQDPTMCQKERLLGYILKQLNLTKPTQCNLAKFIDVMRDELDKPTIILMDEFHLALQAQHSELTEEFWWGIRSLIINQTNGQLGLLVASHRSPLELMPSDDNNKPSPFLNIFEPMILGPFTEDEARDFLTHTPQPVAEADKQWILDNSQCWPALLQILCDAFLNAKTEENWKEAGLRRIQEKPFGNLLDNSNI